jgi:uncharacterized protein (TIGR04255 family)
MPPGRYARPPIIEAVIEVRFASEIAQPAMERFNRTIRREYPLAEAGYEVSVQLEVGQPSAAPRAISAQKFANFKLTDRDGTDLILLGAAQLASIRLAPYCGWETFLTAFKRNYATLRKITGHRHLARVATRYVNRIDVPRREGDKVRSTDYVLIEPRSTTEIVEITGFASRVVGVVPSIDGQVIVNAGTVISPLIDHVSFLLDIDLYKDKDLPTKDEEVWDLLRNLRQHKNILFEAFITDRARELFDHA